MGQEREAVRFSEPCLGRIILDLKWRLTWSGEDWSSKEMVWWWPEGTKLPWRGWWWTEVGKTERQEGPDAFRLPGLWKITFARAKPTKA